MSLLRSEVASLVLASPQLWPQLSGARIFLTGANGFFGCWLLETLLFAKEYYDLDLQVVALTRDPDRFRARAPHLCQRIELLQGAIEDFPIPARTFSHIVHAAAEINSDRGLLAGGQRVLQMKADRYLLVSSGAVYRPSSGILNEEHPTEPTTDYGRAKLQLERDYQDRAVIARCFAFLGPYLSLDSGLAAGDFLKEALARRPITLQSNGRTRRSYLYAGDLAIWLWTLLVRGTPGRAYNVGSPEPITVLELAQKIAGPLPVQTLGDTSGGDYLPDVGRAGTELGLTPTVGWQEAVERTLAWFKSTPWQST